ncbi:SRPBCC family protein [Flavobacterium aquiphilum]|uniref:SRPBCC family protein n=1 Tax=Flavobacterium aquiphilum TaxID=3003261 RepID=UPI00248077B7|nr:SRPBCC family protein [Flavobacterium aquiphilum]
MRIIKYLFLLFLLSLVALTIYIATQKGNFTVESSKVINSPKATVFGYVNDYKNWQKFNTWVSSDKDVRLSFSKATAGNGSSLNWEGSDDSGNIETLYTKGNDSIVQKMELNGSSSKVFWSFKDTVGGTKVTWKSVGKMDFMSKVDAFFNGKPQNSISKVYDKSLANLGKSLDIESTTFDIQVKGIVKKLETFYLRQSFTSKISDITRNANAVFNKITIFCKQNNIALNGRPFIIYHTYDTINDLTRVSFCVPIKEQIFTSQGSDILSGKLAAFEALKTSLTGNYTYKKDALKEAIKYTNDKKILTDSTFSHLEIFTIGKNENLSPSKWQTDIYFPIKPKVVAPVYKKIANDSIAAVPKQQPAVKPQEVKAPSIKTPPVKMPTTIKEKEPSNKKNQDEFEF